MSNNLVHFTYEEWMEFRVKFSYLKHSTNNILSVFLTLAELAQDDPENFQKLAQSIGSRTPEIVAMLQATSAHLDAKGPEPSAS